MIQTRILHRLQQHARYWGVLCEETIETTGSVIAFGTRKRQGVVLKVIKEPSDEWHSGEILEAFDGDGVVEVYEHAPGAMLLKRLKPGNALVDFSLSGRDEEATDILANVIERMSASSSSSDLPKRCPTVQGWAKGFERYLATHDRQVPEDLVGMAQRVYLSLCASQRQPRLLHGDLQHYNVLFDSDSGWLAIDPKGVIGELEYEIGALLRNPIERPDVFLVRSTVERRLKQLTSRLNLDSQRTLAWAFAQSVLSAIWEIEDGFNVDVGNRALRLAEALRTML